VFHPWIHPHPMGSAPQDTKAGGSAQLFKSQLVPCCIFPYVCAFCDNPSRSCFAARWCLRTCAFKACSTNRVTCCQLFTVIVVSDASLVWQVCCLPWQSCSDVQSMNGRCRCTDATLLDCASTSHGSMAQQHAVVNTVSIFCCTACQVFKHALHSSKTAIS
jgi:hypothetical protein